MNKFLISLCFALFFCTSIPLQASAESWVLWVKHESIVPNTNVQPSWVIADAYDNLKNCNTVKERLWLAEKKELEEAMAKYGQIEEIKFARPQFIKWSVSGTMNWVYYYCLPGTLDPRK